MMPRNRAAMPFKPGWWPMAPARSLPIASHPALAFAVDSHGYAGYSPPAAFDPLLAKLVCHTMTR